MFSRTLIATVLTFAAVAVPCGSWYVVGAREAADTAAAIRAKPDREAARLAAGLAMRLAARLEALREQENARPYFHYQPLYRDPEAAAEGEFVVPSPLVKGSGNVLVQVHFSIQEDGSVVLPSLNKDFPELNDPDTAPAQFELSAQLHKVVATCIMAIDQKEELREVLVAASQTTSVREEATSESRTAAAKEEAIPPAKQQALDRQRKGKQLVQSVVVGNEAWEQTKRAAVIYNLHRYGSSGSSSSSSSFISPDQTADFNLSEGRTAQSSAPGPQRAESRQTESLPQTGLAAEANKELSLSRSRQVEENERDAAPEDDTQQANAEIPPAEPLRPITIAVGPLEWRNVHLDDRETLMALRQVKTPDGIRTQGFAVARAEMLATVREYFMQEQADAYDLRLVPGVPKSVAGAARVGIPDADWHVTVDPSSARAAAALRAAEVESRFLRSFILGSLAAAVAGLAVILIVFQSERMARQRSRFAASAAHELRTPLAGMAMYGEMLAEGLGDPSRRQDYARRVADEAQRLGRVVSNVLEFTRLERGEVRVRPEPGDLVPCVSEMIERHQSALEAQGAALECVLPEAPVQASFDRDAASQILQNLLDNAEKYSRAAEDRTIHVALSKTSSGAAITVADRGPGVPRKIRARLFRPFKRARGPDAPAGLGLGLATARALARAQGGRIEYRDRAGGGAEFTLHLPEGSR